MLPVTAPDDPSGAQVTERGDAEDRVLQIQRRADDVAVPVLPRVVGVEPQRVVVADRGGPPLPVAPVHLAGGDGDDLADLLGRLRVDEALGRHRTVSQFISSSSHFAAMSAPPPSVDRMRARSENLYRPVSTT